MVTRLSCVYIYISTVLLARGSTHLKSVCVSGVSPGVLPSLIPGLPHEAQWARERSESLVDFVT